MKLLTLFFLLNSVHASDTNYDKLINLSGNELRPQTYSISIGEGQIPVKVRELLIEKEESNFQLKMERIKQNLLEQLERRGGDDVGNGGDHLRQQFYSELREVGEALSLQIPAYKNILAVTGIGQPLMRVSYGKENQMEDLILLDREIIGQAQKMNRDLRHLIVEVLLPGHKNPESLYQGLNAKEGRPLCYFDFSKEVEERKHQDFKTVHKTSATKAREEAIEECRDRGLSGCFIFSQEHSGMFGNLKHRVTARGYSISQKSLNADQRKQLTCEATLKCEELTFSAPFGQVSPEDFSEISELVQKNCR